MLLAECAVQVGKNRYPLSTKTVQWGLLVAAGGPAPKHRGTGHDGLGPAISLPTLDVQGVE